MELSNDEVSFLNENIVQIDLSLQMAIDCKKDQGYIKRDLCFTDNLNVIKLLLEEGTNIDGLCICGHTAIHYHTKSNNFDIVKYLLSKGADVNKKNIYGDDIYNDALEWERTEIYEYLIKNKKRVKERERKKRRKIKLLAQSDTNKV